MITTVFIDIDNTLLDFDKCAEMSAVKTFNDMGIEYSDKVFTTFTGINNRLWRDYENGVITKPELHKVRWNLIFEELGIDADGQKCEGVFYSYLRESCEPVSGAIDILRYLHSRYTVCATSNSGYEQQRTRLENAHMTEYIDHIFVSEDIGFQKPEKAFFDECFKRLGGASDKCRTIIIGDSLNADINGGKAYGIKTCWYNPLYNGGFTDADYAVKSLSEIKNIL